MEMYKDVIHNFIFFKNFNNPDFVIRVILAFQPNVYSKYERLVNEGDYIDEIFFVKRGRLALEIPLPFVITNDTIKKIETIKAKENVKLNLLKNISSVNSFKKNNIPKVIDIPNKETLKGKNDYMNIKKEILPQQYIKIIEIRKNEHFGDILMFLNQKSPLSVKVKSKICELFLLKKADAIEISMDFPKIWRKIIKKSLFNMEQIERLINKTLKFFFIHIWRKIIKKSLFNMEQIERLINKTLKFFFIHNEGENNKKANNEHYYKRDIDKLLNYEPNDFLVKNINEEYELKSIPSEDYEESEKKKKKISNNDILSSVKTIIKEEEDEESSFNEEEFKLLIELLFSLFF